MRLALAGDYNLGNFGYILFITTVALLAAIAIPNLLRAKMTANDSAAMGALRTLSTASETFATANSGSYPTAMLSLTGATPPYMSRNYDATTLGGFGYACVFGAASYTFTATPVTLGTSGTTIFTVTTGGVLTPPS